MTSFIRSVLVYKGHDRHPLVGPYTANVEKQIQMFHLLNEYRQKEGRPLWEVLSVPGEELISTLAKSKAKETLLVIPAGQSSHLDAVFSLREVECIRENFLGVGGRLYATCGASYMLSQTREYDGLCTQNPSQRELVVKQSILPLFAGTAKGPLCPFPGKKYQVGFYSDAVTVTNGVENCTVYLSGGGSFLRGDSAQKAAVLVKYLGSELLRFGKKEEECEPLSSATILAKVGGGAALLSMFHPYYSANDIDVKLYESAFPDCGTNWREVKARLSSLDERMRFVLKAMLYPLEDAVAESP